jgi:UTP--glucose-1-phosphate uridylyltransferase
MNPGDKLSYLKANVILAAERDDLGPELRVWLKDYAASLSVE